MTRSLQLEMELAQLRSTQSEYKGSQPLWQRCHKRWPVEARR